MEVRYSPQAKDDLLEIWLYIARDNVSAADRWIDHIEDPGGTIQSLAGPATSSSPA